MVLNIYRTENLHNIGSQWESSPEALISNATPELYQKYFSLPFLSLFFCSTG